MGFFTSSKPEPRAPEVGHGPGAQGGVTNVIRSRFYGKGKERAAFNNLGNGSSPQDRETVSGQSAANKSFGRASGRKVKASIPGSSSMPTGSGNNPSTSSHLTPGPRPGTQLSPPRNSRTSADTITMTLAQRLGELATANEQGLLDDDEYRLLRANLFERFANASTVPSEAPIVRLSVSAHQNSHVPSPSTHTSRSTSVHSKSSIVSTFSGLLRRATSRRFNSSPGSQPPTSSDSMIPPSTPSPVQNRTLPRRLRREASDSSIGSEMAAHRPNESRRSGTPTSRKSRNPPPSSYSNRAFKSVPHTPTRDHTHRSPDEFDLNGEHIQSVKELRAEIEAVEAEGRRLLDAFNGLELSTLTKRQRRPIPPQVTAETDEGSIHSGRSASLRGPRQVPTNSNSQPLVSQPITLSRKNSLSSMSSRGRSAGGSHHPTLPSASSNSLGRYGTSTGSTPSVNNAGFPTLETVDEASDPALAALESEMADIRRRRAEVVARYEAKLELLRAKLKGAEIHEKLLKR